MKGVFVLRVPDRWWKCPSCHAVAKHPANETRNPAHPCPAVHGLNIPFLPVASPDAKADGRHLVVQREDGSGVAFVSTEHGDGSNDVNVFLETAQVQAKGIDV
jgi:hypothetical protein